MKCKIIYFFIISSFLFLDFSCDGYVIIKGNVLESGSHSFIIPDSVYATYKLTNPIQNAMVNFYDISGKDSVYNFIFPTIFTDSLGYFSSISGVGCGKYRGLAVVTKNGFIPDSLYFEYEFSKDPLIFIINLKKLK